MSFKNKLSQNKYLPFAQPARQDIFRPVNSVYMTGAENAKTQLDAISPTMCLAKWLQVSLQLTTGRTQSCYHPPTHRIPLNELEENVSALHNTKFKKQQRSLMLKGQRPKECETCWKMEDLAHLSDRHYRSSEEWSLPFINEVLSAGAEQAIVPKYVEVNFNHACQLKCSYCSPHISSSWYEEIKKYGAYPTLQPHNSLLWLEQQELVPYKQSDDNPYAVAFWKWWPEIYSSLRVFRMTGGEPLMDINTYKVLDYILENPKRDLKISVTSNFSVQPELIDKFILRAKKISDGKFVERFTLFVSCDSVGSQAEYIRFGLDYKKFIENVDRFLTEVSSGVVNFIITMTNLNVFGLSQLIEELLKLRKKHSRYFQRVWFDTPPLHFPEWQSLKILPPDFESYIENTIDWMKSHRMTMQTTSTRLHGFHDYEVLRLQRVLDWARDGRDENQKDIKNKINFYRFFHEHDLRRQTQFVDVFPQLKGFWSECRDLDMQSKKLELNR